MTNGHTNGSNSAPFGRLLTAMVTPFDDAGEVDYKQAQVLARSIIDAGGDGLVITGTTGEVPTLTRDEKLNLYRAVIEAVGQDAAVIAGTGTYNTRESIEASREAEEVGADGLLLTVPYYNKPTQEGIFQHFKAIADAVDLPCILYNIPGRTSINMAPETIVRAGREISNVIGVKEASGNLEAMATIVEDAGPDFHVWSGDDSVTLPLLSVGGYGVICTCSNMVASQMRAIIDAFVAGKVVEAAALHRRLLPLMSALMTVAANPVPIKHAMNQRGFKVGGVRQPLWDLDEAASAKLMGIVGKYAVDLPVGAGV
ncbi:MAG TPA: 4-hydroxy-tetrahydrodipicolinate synthase [Dehalococcoidia bacterium]|nr:4-hydroxy-tetrahydrodipicolinate synthase [Dehalococcoidia bacterium]